jgi:hypothetical protein
MPQSHRDHGVAEGTHWLLDEELVPRRPARAARPLPVLLRHDEPLQPAGERVLETAPAPSTDAFRFAVGLLAALLLYLLLRGADVGGALPGSLPGESDHGSVVISATLVAEPEVAALRALLGRVPSSNRGRREDRSARSSTPVELDAPKPPVTEEPVLPLQPPAPPQALDPLTLLREVPQTRRVIEDLERATGLELERPVHSG